MFMSRAGLVSVTFRGKDPAEVIELAVKARLDGIEWGGDIHVPVGDLACARKVQNWTNDAGLQTVSYGSYYRAGEPGQEFAPVLETAINLGAPMVRVWAGSRGSAEKSDNRVEADLAVICDQAAEAGLIIALEYHAGTLTDTIESTLKLLATVDHPSLRCHWQPPVDMSPDLRLSGLVQIRPYLAHMHVFNWVGPHGRTGGYPLAEAESEWRPYLEQGNVETFALLEFVKDDSVDQFFEDARTLKSWLG